MQRLSKGGKEHLHKEEQEKWHKRNDKTDTDMPEASEPQRIPNRLAADLQILSLSSGLCKVNCELCCKKVKETEEGK